MTLEEKDAYIAEHLMDLQPDTLRFLVADLVAEIEHLKSSLTRSKAEGRREAFEEAARIAEEWRGTMSMFLHVEDCRAHNTACGQIAAAIRQQAVQERGPE